MRTMILTESARNAVQALIADAPSEAGLRIATDVATNGRQSPVLTLRVTTGPEPTDEVMDEQGARVFLEPDAAAMLGDQTLDAELDEAKQVTFFVR